MLYFLHFNKEPKENNESPQKISRHFIVFYGLVGNLPGLRHRALGQAVRKPERPSKLCKKPSTPSTITISAHQDAIAKTDFYRFQENVFRLQAPEFARITAAVFTQGRKHGFNPYLVMAVIFVESRFDRRAVSRAGAYGLMQVNYPVWKDELNIDRRKTHPGRLQHRARAHHIERLPAGNQGRHHQGPDPLQQRLQIHQQHLSGKDPRLQLLQARQDKLRTLRRRPAGIVKIIPLPHNPAREGAGRKNRRQFPLKRRLIRFDGSYARRRA